jgi:hypothetical protein
MDELVDALNTKNQQTLNTTIRDCGGHRTAAA